MNRLRSYNIISVLLILFIAIFTDNLKAQEINDLIQPLHLTAGHTDSVLISDVFYAPDYEVKFQSDENVEVDYNPNSKIIAITPAKNYDGLDLVNFIYNKEHYFFPVISNKKITVTFNYKTNENPKKVNLFGSFNGWNRENIPMEEIAKGEYQASVELDPGRYEYKYFIDGKEILDPANPVTAPNGIGGFNSIIVIKSKNTGKFFLHVLGLKTAKDNNIFSYYLEDVSHPKLTLEKKSVFALLNNHKISDKFININGREIDVSMPKSELIGKKVLRVAVSKNGRTTLFQTTHLNGNKPEGYDKNLTLQDYILYSIMIDRFDNGDKKNDNPIRMDSLSYKANYQGGDFRGILDKLNQGYFDSLGINTLWISPVVDNPDSAYHESPPPHRLYTGYHGYWPLHLKQVEEHFGNMALLKRLIATAHKHNIKVLFDFVSHHVFIKNILYQKHRNWFGVLDLPDGRKNLRMWDEYRLTTWFDPYLPTFDYLDSRAAVDYMTDNAIWWLKETNADGFRHDAVKHVPNVFWRVLTRKLKEQIEIPEHKNMYQIGETFGSYDLVSSYVNNGQLNAQFNFNLYDIAIPTFIKSSASFSALDNEMQKSFEVYGMNNLMGNIMDSHDKVRFISYADGDVPINGGDAAEIGWDNPPKVDHESSYKKLDLYLAYEMSIPGVPVVDYGDEIGLPGAADPDNRRMMRFGKQLSKWEKENLAEVKKIVNLRKNNPALRYGDFYTLKADTNCYVYTRSDFNQRILIALNKSDKAQTVNIELPEFYNVKQLQDLTTNNRMKIKNNKIDFSVPAIGFKFFLLK